MDAEPTARWGYFSTSVEGLFYLYGGLTKDFLNKRGNLASNMRVYSFDPYLESWSKRLAQGQSYPPGLYNGACASSGQNVYVYGGNNGSRLQSSLHQLDTKTLTWTQLSQAGPMRMIGCGMINHGNCLLLFGGYGEFSDPSHPELDFFQDITTKDSGWSNVLHSFDLKEGEGFAWR